MMSDFTFSIRSIWCFITSAISSVYFIKIDEITIRKAIEYCNLSSTSYNKDICQDFSKISASIIIDGDYMKFSRHSLFDITLLTAIYTISIIVVFVLFGLCCNDPDISLFPFVLPLFAAITY